MTKKIVACFLALLVFCVQGCRDDLIGGDDLTAARKAYAERNLPLTERLLERYLREEQDSGKRWLGWQLLLQALNADRVHARASLECLDAMLVEYEDDTAKLAEILPQVGRYNRELRHFPEAAEAWNSYLDLPDLDMAQRVEGYRQLAAMQFRQKHYVAAEETLQQCFALPGPDQEKIPCILDLAEENMLRDQPEEVSALAMQILESGPDGEIRGRACFLLGDALEQMDKPEEALGWFEKAREDYPNPLVIENRIAHLQKKKEEK